MSHVAWSVCVSVCLLGTKVSPAKTAEPIEMPFGADSPEEPYIRCGQVRTNPFAVARGDGLDAAFRQNSSSACYTVGLYLLCRCNRFALHWKHNSTTRHQSATRRRPPTSNWYLMSRNCHLTTWRHLWRHVGNHRSAHHWSP